MLQWANPVDMSTTLPVNVRLREILQGSCACTCVLRVRHRESVYSLTGKETETQQDQPVYTIHMVKWKVYQLDRMLVELEITHLSGKCVLLREVVSLVQECPRLQRGSTV